MQLRSRPPESARSRRALALKWRALDPERLGPLQSKLFVGYGPCPLQVDRSSGPASPEEEVVDLQVRVPVVAIPYPVPR